MTVSASPNRERFTGGVIVDGDATRSEWLDLIHVDDQDDVLRLSTESYENGTQFEASYRLVGYDDVERWVLDRNVPYDTGDGRDVRLGLVLDVSDRRQLERRLQSSVDQLRAANTELRTLRMQAEQQARTDVVTGAHNRLALSEHVALALEAGHDGGLVLLDLDHFKQINDALGHGAGDRVLVEVARRLHAAARPRRLRGPLGRRGVRRTAARRQRRDASSPDAPSSSSARSTTSRSSSTAST